MLCHVEELQVLDKLLIHLSYGDFGHEFNVNESTMYIKWMYLS